MAVSGLSRLDSPGRVASCWQDRYFTSAALAPQFGLRRRQTTGRMQAENDSHSQTIILIHCLL